MLNELRIRNVAIIESVALPLRPGLNVLTGETGAGKSIIVEALGLLFGERGSADLVRNTAERASVEGTFDAGQCAAVLAAIDQRGVEVEDGQLVFRREVTNTGRSRAWINGSPVTAGILAELGRGLVDVHGQHESRGLLDPEVQQSILDAYGRAEQNAKAVASAYDVLNRVREERATLAARRASAEKRLDYLRHVVEEIAGAKLVTGEDERLEEEARRLSHAVELRQLALHLRQALDDEESGAIHRLGEARRALHSAVRLDPTLSALQELLDAMLTQAEELSRQLVDYESALETDPARLTAVEQRRDLIFRVTRKYGGGISQALEALRECREELELVDRSALDLGALSQRERECEAALTTAAATLTAARTRAATRLGQDVERLLPALGLAEGRFAVALLPRDAPGRTGNEAVEFRVALNVGHDARALARVASGGELARVMLALQTILARLERTPTLIFDEVDSGIGGTVALRVADALRELAAHHQIFVVTHLPQIAARAHHHIVVRKGATQGVTTADVQVVESEERVREIARMLGGDPESERSRAHARELLART
jgi:DNA repair protein RecN (Recombination protein N)